MPAPALRRVPVLLSLLIVAGGALYGSVDAAHAEDTGEPPFRFRLTYRSPGAFTLERGKIELSQAAPKALASTFTESRSAWAWYQRSLNPDLSAERAMEYCRTAVLIDRRFALAHNHLAVLQYESGKVAQAKRTWRTAIRANPELISARANAALMYYLERKPGPARKHLRVALATEADHAPLQNTLGLIYELENNLSAAAAAYRIAAEQDENYLPAWKNLARVYPNGGVSAGEALNALNTAIAKEQNPSEQAALQGMAADLVGARAPEGSLGLAGTPNITPTGLVKPDRPAARRTVRITRSGRRRLRSQSWRGPRTTTATAVASVEAAQDTPPALSAPASSGTPASLLDGPAPRVLPPTRPPEVYEWYNKALASEQTSPARVSALYTALEIDPSFVGGYVALGDALVALEDSAAALAAFETALELEPERVEALEGRARQLRALGRNDDALVTGRRWTDAAPRSADAWRFVGERQVESGAYDAATQSLHTALALSPKDARVHYALGLLAYQQGDLDRAAIAYQKTVEADPTFAKAYHNLGLTLRKLDRPEDAIYAYRRAIDLAPDWDVAYNSIGNLYRTMGDCTHALGAFTRAVELNPNNPHAYTNMGLCHEAQGAVDAAITAFSKAVEIAPGARWTQVARERIAMLTADEEAAE